MLTVLGVSTWPGLCVCNDVRMLQHSRLIRAGVSDIFISYLALKMIHYSVSHLKVRQALCKITGFLYRNVCLFVVFF